MQISAANPQNPVSITISPNFEHPHPPVPTHFSPDFGQNSAQNDYYYGLRFYNAESGRWINRDPIGKEGGNNEYRFINNRLNLNDYLGLCTISGGIITHYGGAISSKDGTVEGTPFRELADYARNYVNNNSENAAFRNEYQLTYINPWGSAGIQMMGNRPVQTQIGNNLYPVPADSFGVIQNLIFFEAQICDMPKCELWTRERARVTRQNRNETTPREDFTGHDWVNVTDQGACRKARFLNDKRWLSFIYADAPGGTYVKSDYSQLSNNWLTESIKFEIEQDIQIRDSDTGGVVYDGIGAGWITFGVDINGIQF